MEKSYPLKFSSQYCIYVYYKEKRESSRDPLAPKISSDSSVVNKSKCWPNFHTAKFSFYQESGFAVKAFRQTFPISKYTKLCYTWLHGSWNPSSSPINNSVATLDRVLQICQDLANIYPKCLWCINGMFRVNSAVQPPGLKGLLCPFNNAQ